MLSAATPASLSAATWSCISATSGDTTTVRPFTTSAGTWKQSDLPEPVGITASALLPARSASITASWPGRNPANPNTSRSTRRAAVAPFPAESRVPPSPGDIGRLSNDRSDVLRAGAANHSRGQAASRPTRLRPCRKLPRQPEAPVFRLPRARVPTRYRRCPAIMDLATGLPMSGLTLHGNLLARIGRSSDPHAHGYPCPTRYRFVPPQQWRSLSMPGG